MAQITFDDKEALIDNPNIPRKNKITDDDINEIKRVVNENEKTGGGGDSIPVGSILDYDGTEVPAGYEKVTDYKTYKEYTLYKNASGTNKNITLNDNVENYSYCEIFFRSSDGLCNSVKIEEPNGKKGWLSSGFSSENSFNSKLITVQFVDDKLNILSGVEYGINGTPNYSSRGVYITKVTGSKEV